MRVIDGELLERLFTGAPPDYYSTAKIVSMIRECHTIDLTKDYAYPVDYVVEHNVNNNPLNLFEVHAYCPKCTTQMMNEWKGYFPAVPYNIAKDVALSNAKNAIEIPTYCPECGVRLTRRQ